MSPTTLLRGHKNLAPLENGADGYIGLKLLASAIDTSSLPMSIKWHIGENGLNSSGISGIFYFSEADK